MVYELKLHVDDVDVVLIYFLLVLKDLITRRKFSEFQLHLFLLCQLLELL